MNNQDGKKESRLRFRAPSAIIMTTIYALFALLFFFVMVIVIRKAGMQDKTVFLMLLFLLLASLSKSKWIIDHVLCILFLQATWLLTFLIWHGLNLPQDIKSTWVNVLANFCPIQFISCYSNWAWWWTLLNGFTSS